MPKINPPGPPGTTPCPYTEAQCDSWITDIRALMEGITLGEACVECGFEAQDYVDRMNIVLAKLRAMVSLFFPHRMSAVDAITPPRLPCPFSEDVCDSWNTQMRALKSTLDLGAACLSCGLQVQDYQDRLQYILNRVQALKAKFFPQAA